MLLCKFHHVFWTTFGLVSLTSSVALPPVTMLVLLQVVVEDDDGCEEVLDDRGVDVQVVI